MGEINKKVYRIGKNLEVEPHGAMTEKSINPMGGFPGYGHVKNEWVMIKGNITGPPKRALTLRKSLKPRESRIHLEKVTLKFIDTSSKKGHGRFQTSDEKAKFYGLLKKDNK